MNKLWVFGDSFTEGFDEFTYHSKVSIPDWRKQYIDWKGYVPQVFNTILANKLNIETINCGIGGADNYTIFHTIIKNIEKIKKDDTVIIGWSSVLRLRVATRYDKFISIQAWMLSLTYDKLQDIGIDIPQQTLLEMANNRVSYVYIDEINDYIKILKLLLKSNKIIFWSPFYDNLKMGMLVTPIPQLKSIGAETKSKVSDGHFSEDAHFELAEHFYNILTNDKKTLL